MRVRARAGVPRLPHAGAPAEALRGGRAGDRRDARRSCASVAPDVVVADILTLAPALAAELEGVPVATLIPHVDPRPAPGFAPYSLGARLPRTALGRAGWSLLDPRDRPRAWSWGGASSTRRAGGSGCPRRGACTAGSRERLALVATFPQLEYPRAAPPPNTHVIGPLLWEPAFGEVELPPGRRAARPRRALDRAGRPAHACCAPRSRASATSPVCGCWRRGTGGRWTRRTARGASRRTRGSSSG